MDGGGGRVGYQEDAVASKAITYSAGTPYGYKFESHCSKRLKSFSTTCFLAGLDEQPGFKLHPK